MVQAQSTYEAIAEVPYGSSAPPEFGKFGFSVRLSYISPALD